MNPYGGAPLVSGDGAPRRYLPAMRAKGLSVLHYAEPAEPLSDEPLRTEPVQYVPICGARHELVPLDDGELLDVDVLVRCPRCAEYARYVAGVARAN